MRGNKNKGHMSCAVERKTATQIIASEPKLVSCCQRNKVTCDQLFHAADRSIPRVV